MRRIALRSSLIIFLACFVYKSYAQIVTVKGVVNDKASGKTLPNSTIKIKSISSNNFDSSFLSDQNGSFLITVPQPGLYQIAVSYVGYQNSIQDSVRIDNQHTSMPAFYLVLAGKDLEGIKVSSAKKPFVVLGVNKITLNVAQSAIASGGTAYDVLKNAPGMMEQNDALNFRGKSISVLINGRPSNLSGEELKTMLTNMQASGIEKVEILPNPSAKYDASGGSVVNIILAKNKLFGTNYVLATGIGTGKYIRGNAGLDVNYRNKNINIFGGYNFNYNKQYYQTNSIRYLDNGTISSDEYDQRQRNNHGYKFGVDYDVSKRSSIGILVNGYVNYRDRGVVDNSTLHYNTNTSDSSSQVLTNGKAILKNPTVNLYYKTTLDSTGKELTINADYLNYNKAWHDDFTNKYYDGLGKEYIAPDYLKDNSPANINVYALTADYVWPTKKARWEMGVKTNYTITDNDIVWQTNSGSGWGVDLGKTNHFIYKENVNAAYINYIRSIKKWSIEAGLRAEQTNTEGNSVTTSQKDKNSYADLFPNISLGYTKNENNVFGISYRKSIQRFGFDYVNPFVVYQNQYAYNTGNPYLQPQIDHQFSISYSLKQNLLFGIEYTHSKKSLGVSYSAQNNVTVSSYANFKGADIGYVYANYFQKFFSIWQMNMYAYTGYFNYNVNTATYSQKKNNKPFFGLQMTNSFSLKRGLSIEGSLSYRSSLVSGIFTMDHYFSSDLGINKSMLKGKLNLKLSLTDVFNSQKTHSHTDYQGVNLSTDTKTESRFLNLISKYSFGNNNVRAKRERESKLSDLQGRIN